MDLPSIFEKIKSVAKLREITVDIHVHIFPDAVASTAILRLQEVFKTEVVAEGNLTGLRRDMQGAGVDISVVQGVASRPDQVTSINDWLAKIKAPDIEAFGAIHPDFPDNKKEIFRIKKLGLKGIKLHPELQEFSPDEKRLWTIYQAAEEEELVVLFHMGNLISPRKRIRGTPQKLKKVLRLFPNLKVIAAHLGGYLVWEEVAKYLLGEKVYFDTSYVSPVLSQNSVLEIIRTHGVEKILFGTDYPFCHPREEINFLMGIPFTDKEREAILGENARHLLRLGKNS